MTLVLAFAIGIVAGLRSMTAPAVVAWAGHFGWLQLDGTPLEFLTPAPARYVLLVLMLGELLVDQALLHAEPEGTWAVRWAHHYGRAGWRGGGGWARGSVVAGAVAGTLGAVVGTLGGYQARTGLVQALHVPDYVVALAEDVVAVGGALLVVTAGS
jgi:uncharacterized membrane protein